MAQSGMFSGSFIWFGGLEMMVFLCRPSSILNVIEGSLFLFVNLYFGLGPFPFDYEYWSEKKRKKKSISSQLL